MKSPRFWLSFSLLLIVGFSLTAVAMTGTPPPADAHCVEVEELEVFVCGTTTTSSTTSTTTPSTTSTSSTTTTAPTTTTTQATTTTSVPGALAIPETQYQSIPGFKDNESFRIELACIDVPADNREGLEPVDCDLNSGGKKSIASFDYLGHGMPYMCVGAVPGEHCHPWWVGADREGYRCATGHLYNQHPNPFGMLAEDRPAHFIHQFAVVRPDDSGYGKINDTYMPEGARYWDGSPANEGQEIQSEDCQALALALNPDFNYNTYEPHGPDDIRVGLFYADGNIADIRDFTDVEVDTIQGTDTPLGHFEFVSIKNGVVHLVFVYTSTNKVSHGIYYFVRNDGRIAVEVNGQTFE